MPRGLGFRILQGVAICAVNPPSLCTMLLYKVRRRVLCRSTANLEICCQCRTRQARWRLLLVCSVAPDLISGLISRPISCDMSACSCATHIC